VTAECCDRDPCPAAQLPAESPAPLQPCPAHTHPPGAAPGRELPSPVPLGKQKEGTTPSLTLLMSSGGYVPREGPDDFSNERPARWCPHRCKGQGPRCRRAHPGGLRFALLLNWGGACSRESPDWFLHGRNHGWHHCQQRPLSSPRILALLVHHSDPGYETAATQPPLLSPGPAKLSWGSGQSPSSTPASRDPTCHPALHQPPPDLSVRLSVPCSCG